MARSFDPSPTHLTIWWDTNGPGWAWAADPTEDHRSSGGFADDEGRDADLPALLAAFEEEVGPLPPAASSPDSWEPHGGDGWVWRA